MDIRFDHPDLECPQTEGKTFRQLPINQLIVEGLEMLTYRKPTVVQYISIPLAIQNINLIVQSKSGTGKTLAFTSVILQKLSNSIKREEKVAILQAMIIAPTRELAVQTHQFIRKVLGAIRNTRPTEQNQKALRSMMNSISVALNIGGLPLQDDKKAYHESGFHIAVGTIGRLYQLAKKDIIKLQNVKTVVLDEGDKLFDEADSLQKLKFILAKLKTCQFLVYSATYTDRCFKQLKSYGDFTFVRTVAVGTKMEVKVQRPDKPFAQKVEELNLANISKFQFIESSSSFNNKLSRCKKVLQQLQYQRCLVFAEKKAQMPQIADYLRELKPLVIHGSLSQSARIKLLNQLNDSKVVLTSDLLARGIDVPLDLIVLFDATQGENFWHRIGRTGRIGRKGVVISLEQIEGWPDIDFEKTQQILSGVEIAQERQLFGQHMAEMGRWYDVDINKEIQNINGYRYFDEQQFQKEIEVELAMENDQQIEQLQTMPTQKLPVVSLHKPLPPIPSFESQAELRQYISQLLSCACCCEHMSRVSRLTGYQFQLSLFQ